ncbi:hypothetical protein [Oceanobacter kriegii]|uniref:hypothetical protein n=1 Tax=Oceanobacter kriegii TaxID=64972 RepID=UPI000410F31B|nr:hypothetical protein [Oceanobacter kriegii]
MIVSIAALLAGFLLGGALVSFWLSQKWKQQVAAAEQSLKEIAEQHKAEQQQSKELQQQVADLTWQLNEANKTNRYLQSRLDGNAQNDN